MDEDQGRPAGAGWAGPIGVTAPDNRLFVDAVITPDRTGILWRDLPERYGGWKATHRRFRRWCESGVFARILAALAIDADALVAPLAERGITPVIPSKANRREPRETDFASYRARNLVERFFCKLKQYRAISTRYDKLANTFLAAVALVCVLFWLN